MREVCLKLDDFSVCNIDAQVAQVSQQPYAGVQCHTTPLSIFKHYQLPLKNPSKKQNLLTHLLLVSHFVLLIIYVHTYINHNGLNSCSSFRLLGNTSSKAPQGALPTSGALVAQGTLKRFGSHPPGGSQAPRLKKRKREEGKDGRS